MKDLMNKTCLITGAASGIGRSFAIALAKEGMRLFLTDIDLENLEETKLEVEKVGAEVYIEKCDVSLYKDFEKVAVDFTEKLGDLDLLINNAGIAIIDILTQVELEDWKRVLDVNLWSIIHSLKIFLPKMVERKSGHIVNVASAAGVIGTSEPLPYTASKFAVVGISEALYGQLNRYGINVSVIVPLYVKTNIFSTSKIRYPKKMIEDFGEEKVKEIYKSLVDDMASKAISPDRAVKQYLKGIKNDQLYIYDLRTTRSACALKGTNPEQYEKFLINYNKSVYETRKNHFLKHGINIDDYI